RSRRLGNSRAGGLAGMMLAKVLYGALFLVAVPALLILWARVAEPNVALLPYGNPTLGAALAACGLALIVGAMLDMWRVGGGLPMNAFPPPRLVSSGTFRWLPHPIYTGFS